MTKLAIACMFVLAVAAPALADKPVPSGKVKAYKGPEGELIVMLEVNKSTEMLVHFRKLGDDLDGTTLLYELDDKGDHGKDVYVNKKRGSKTYRSIMLSERDGEWEFYHPSKPTKHFVIVYSEKDSDAVTVDDVIKAYHP